MTLLVKARGSALVPDYNADAGGTKRFIGRRLDPTIGVEGEHIDDKGNKSRVMSGGWVPGDEPVEIAPLPEYAAHIADGELYAANEETAKWAFDVTKRRVEFDPDFGEEPKAKSATQTRKSVFPRPEVPPPAGDGFHSSYDDKKGT